MAAIVRVREVSDFAVSDSEWGGLRGELANATANVLGCRAAGGPQPIYHALWDVNYHSFVEPVEIAGKSVRLQSGAEAIAKLDALCRKLRSCEPSPKPAPKALSEIVMGAYKNALRKAWISTRLGRRYLHPNEIRCGLLIAVLDLVKALYVDYNNSHGLEKLVQDARNAVNEYAYDLDGLIWASR
ncbi:MAG: hypothetical protein QHG98_07400 [Methanothrix sp.]|jgi:hypothetical protein|nr:hypothetical protein [Methanothrix sp.]